jgi:hypothetical protein
MPLARRGRRGRAVAGQILARVGVGGGEGLAYGHQELTAHPWVGLGRRGVTGGEIPTATEAAAERSSSARGFPARRVAKLGPNSCSRRRRSYWDGWFGRRRGGGKGSMATGSHRRRVERRRLGSGEGLASGWGRKALAWSGEAF